MVCRMEQQSCGSPGRRRTEDDWRALVLAWRASGLSAREFCSQRGIAKSGLWKWSGKFQQPASPPAAKGKAIAFVPLHVTPKAGGMSPDTGGTQLRVTLEVVGCDGISARFYEGSSRADIEAVVTAMSRRERC